MTCEARRFDWHAAYIGVRHRVYTHTVKPPNSSTLRFGQRAHVSSKQTRTSDTPSESDQRDVRLRKCEPRSRANDSDSSVAKFSTHKLFSATDA